MGVERCLTLVLLSTSLMTYDTEHLFIKSLLVSFIAGRQVSWYPNPCYSLVTVRNKIGLRGLLSSLKVAILFAVDKVLKLKILSHLSSFCSF